MLTNTKICASFFFILLFVPISVFSQVSEPIKTLTVGSTSEYKEFEWRFKFLREKWRVPNGPLGIESNTSLNQNLNASSQIIPYHRPMSLAISVPIGQLITQVEVCRSRFGKLKDIPECSRFKKMTLAVQKKEGSTVFYLPLGALSYGQHFQLTIETTAKEIEDAPEKWMPNTRTNGTEGTATEYTYVPAVGQKDETYHRTVYHLSTTPPKAIDRLKAHFKVDLGLVVPFFQQNFANGNQKIFILPRPVIGLNFHPWPVNPDVPIRAYHWLAPHRFSPYLGVTLGTLSQEGQRNDLLGTNNLVLGVNYSIWSGLRIGSGVLLFEEVSANPLSTATKVEATPVITVTFDYSINEIISAVSSAFGIK